MTLPNGLSFLARYERVSTRNLQSNITKTTKKGCRTIRKRFEPGKNLRTSGTLAEGLDIGSKSINSEIGKKLVNEGIKHSPKALRLKTHLET